MFLNEKLETMSRQEIEQVQLERLQATLNRTSKVIPFYKDFFREKGFGPEDIRSLGDLNRLPLISRDDLARHYPYGMFSVPLREIVRLYPTAVPFAHPLVVGYTQSDITRLSKLAARVLFSAGVKKEDVVLISFSSNIFNGAFIVMFGAELLGASVIPCGDANPEDILNLLMAYRVTKLVTTPYVAIMLSNIIEEKKFNPRELFLKSVILGGEILPPFHRRRVEETLMSEVFEVYGMEDITSPGVGGECSARGGMHINEDHLIAEIIDTHTREVLPEGRMGELVLTSIHREGFPLLRYRTGNITSLSSEKCACGRSFRKMKNITGRTDGRMVIDGISILPQHIEKILSSYEQTTQNYRIIIDRQDNRDRLELEVGVTQEIFVDEMRKMEAVKAGIKQNILNNLGINASIRLVEPKSIPYPWKPETNVVDCRHEKCG